HERRSMGRAGFVSQDRDPGFSEMKTFAASRPRQFPSASFRIARFSLAVWLLVSRAAAQPAGTSEILPPVTPPPDSFFAKVRPSDLEVARGFYKKFIDVKGLPVVASGEVADEALQRTYYLVTH